MVYRGKPSAGCENCRKAKKRCGLEQPACLRCVKLHKVCSGYRDTTQLQIQDESESVRRKATKTRKRSPPLKTAKPQDASQTPSTPGALTVVTPRSESAHSIPDNASATLPIHEKGQQLIDFNAAWGQRHPDAAGPSTWLPPPPPSILPGADDMATNYFFDQFTASSGHWTFLRESDLTIAKDPLLDKSMRACGMAALHNVKGVVMGREYARFVYGEAITLLNTALRDPKMCKLDSTLLSVAMLGYYENLVCDSVDSVRSWKAHISGATQLLRLRGKSQFKSSVGRMLYREIRTQVLINCIWDEREPPAFILEWEKELQKQSALLGQVAAPPDRLAVISFDVAMLRYQIKMQLIAPDEGAKLAQDLQTRMIQWSMSTTSFGEAWQCADLAVPPSPHVWHGTVHAYNSLPAAGTWNIYRSIRIMITRIQEVLCRQLGLPENVRRARVAHFRSVRRDMTEEICRGIPSQLGHAAPALNSPCVLITAYASIWPLFFAATCALERIGYDVWEGMLTVDRENLPDQNIPAAAEQLAWIVGRIKHIGDNVGLRWASGFARVLRGDANLSQDVVAGLVGVTDHMVKREQGVAS